MLRNKQPWTSLILRLCVFAVYVYKPRRKQDSRVTTFIRSCRSWNCRRGKRYKRYLRSWILPGDMHRHRKACVTQNINKANISNDGSLHGGSLLSKSITRARFLILYFIKCACIAYDVVCAIFCKHLAWSERSELRNGQIVAKSFFVRG